MKHCVPASPSTACLPADRRPRAPRSGACGCRRPPGPALVVVTKDDASSIFRASPRHRADSSNRTIPSPRFAPPLPPGGSDRLPRYSRTRRPTEPTTGCPSLLAPCDLQAIKASGVTFVSSMLERVIEEQTRGDPAKAEAVRAVARRARSATILQNVRPGSPEATRVKDALVRAGRVVAVSRGGHRSRRRDLHQGASRCRPSELGAEIGIHPKSEWNNPEPEIVLAVNSRGRDGRRHARQRRQSARLRGAQRAAARQGQGQQRVLRDRAVHSPLRRRFRHRRRAPLRARDARRRSRGVRARRRELDAR